MRRMHSLALRLLRHVTMLQPLNTSAPIRTLSAINDVDHCWLKADGAISLYCVLSAQEVRCAGPAHDAALDADTGVYVGCMYTEYLDGVLAKQVRRSCLGPARCSGT